MSVMVARHAPWFGRFARQVIGDVALHTTIVLGAAVALFMTIDSVEAVNRALSRATLGDMFRLQVYNVPAIVQQFAVFAALLGATSAFCALLRRGEIVAIFAAGGSPSALFRPALLIGLVAALLYAAMTETIAPRARAGASAARRRLGLPSQSQDGFDTHRAWFKGANFVYRVGALEDSKGSILGNVLMLSIDNGRLRERWDFERLRYENDTWIGEGALHRVFTDDGTPATLPDRVPLIRERPRDFVTRIGAPEHLSLGDLLEATRTRSRLGQPSALHAIELYRRLAYPLAIAAVVLFAAALALALGRAPALGTALGAGSLAGFMLWFLDEMALAMGSAGAVKPMFAALIMPALASAFAAAGWVIAQRRGLTIR